MTVLSWAKSLTWLALDMNIFIFSSRTAWVLLTSEVVWLTFLHIFVLIIVLIFCVTSLACCSALFELFLATWLETVVDDECRLVDVKVSRSCWIVEISLGTHRSFVTWNCRVHCICWVLKCLLNLLLMLPVLLIAIFLLVFLHFFVFLNSVKRINLLVHSCSQLLIQINSNQQINYTPKLIWMFQMPSWITCHLNTWKTYNLTFRKIQISLLKIIWISIQY